MAAEYCLSNELTVADLRNHPVWEYITMRLQRRTSPSGQYQKSPCWIFTDD
jgi:hypothetical protein